MLVLLFVVGCVAGVADGVAGCSCALRVALSVVLVLSWRSWMLVLLFVVGCVAGVVGGVAECWRSCS